VCPIDVHHISPLLKKLYLLKNLLHTYPLTTDTTVKMPVMVRLSFIETSKSHTGTIMKDHRRREMKKPEPIFSTCSTKDPTLLCISVIHLNKARPTLPKLRTILVSINTLWNEIGLKFWL
jgi:hypothetical protein